MFRKIYPPVFVVCTPNSAIHFYGVLDLKSLEHRANRCKHTHTQTTQTHQERKTMSLTMMATKQTKCKWNNQFFCQYFTMPYRGNFNTSPSIFWFQQVEPHDQWKPWAGSLILAAWSSIEFQTISKWCLKQSNIQMYLCLFDVFANSYLPQNVLNKKHTIFINFPQTSHTNPKL